MKKTYDPYPDDENENWFVCLRYLDTIGSINSRKMLMDSWNAFDEAIEAEKKLLLDFGGYVLKNEYPNEWSYVMHDQWHTQWNGDKITFDTLGEYNAFIDYIKSIGYVRW